MAAIRRRYADTDPGRPRWVYVWRWVCGWPRRLWVTQIKTRYRRVEAWRLRRR